MRFLPPSRSILLPSTTKGKLSGSLGLACMPHASRLKLGSTDEASTLPVTLPLMCQQLSPLPYGYVIRISVVY